MPFLPFLENIRPHWRKTKWEVCRSLTQLGNPFLITDAALRPTGDIMEIKPEGGTFKVVRVRPENITLHPIHLSLVEHKRLPVICVPPG